MSLHKFLGLAPPPSKKLKTVETCREYEAEKRKNSFQSNWLNKFTWLEHKTDKMYCKVCLKYEKTNCLIFSAVFKFTIKKIQTYNLL